jgi:hypothetical protein
VSVALVKQHAKRMRHIRPVLLSAACLAQSYISTLLTGRFSGNKLLKTKCIFRFSPQLLSETFFILRGTEQDNVYLSCLKYPLFLSDFDEI